MRPMESARPARSPRSRPLSLGVSAAAALVISLWLSGTPPGLLGKAGAVGYAICHQILERTFLIEGDPMPLCARCTGIYLGVMAFMLYAAAHKRLRAAQLPPWPALIVLFLGGAVMAADGLNSYIQLFPGTRGVYLPTNPLRLITGMLAGLAAANLLLPLFNRSVWAVPEERRIVAGWRDLLGLYGLGAAAIVLILAERPVFRWILGFVSVSGVLLTLCLIGTVFFMGFFRIRRAVRPSDLAVPMLAGLTLTMLEIGAISVLRFALTGTWAGFVLG